MKTDLLSKITKIHEVHPLYFELLLNEKKISLDTVEIKTSLTPVKEPTKRGEIYFTDKTEHKIKAVTGDTSIMKFLSHAMLGPNTSFQNITLKTKFRDNLKQRNISLITNLTNIMHNSSRGELFLIVKDILEN